MNPEPRRASEAQSPEAEQGSPRQGAAAFYEAGLRLLKAGQIVEAEQCGRQALAIDAGHADSLHLLGLLSFASGHTDLAIEWFALAIRQNPNSADYFSNLGVALQRQGRFEEAIKSFDRALVLRPDVAEGWYKFGQLLQQQNRLDEAILSYDRALALDPGHLEAANAGALLHFETNRLEAAIDRFEASLRIDPTQAGALHFKGVCQLRLKRYEEALENCRKALALAPDNAEIINNTGLVLQKLGRHEEALLHFDRAIAHHPDFALAFNHRGTTLAELHRFDEALASYDRAIAIVPGFIDAHWNAALYKLLLGDFAGGWPEREWGRKSAAVGFIDRKFPQPRWRGEAPTAGKTILLHSDEGLGDTIQFCRYATLAAARGARVILEVQDVLQPLLMGLDGVAQCLPKTLPETLPELPHFDLHCPLSDLPLAFATRLDTIPAVPRYLPAPPPARVQDWEQRLGPHDRLRVGLVWSGNPNHGNDRNRSMPLAALGRLLDADARFVSLQKDPRPGDQAVLAGRRDVIDLTAHLADFVETAALACCLDLVITVDTSVAHLAAALGRPTWIMLPYTPDYRWLLDRDDSPWYPTVRLFRQDASRDYAPVIARVRDALGERIAAFARPAVERTDR